MTPLDSSLAPDPFLQLAVKLSILKAETAERLAMESLDRRLMPSQLALQKGLLTPTQIDIVQTLLRPDDSVPGYQLLSPLGHGGMGVVYRARQKNLNRTVALKTVLINQMGDDSIVQRFENEAQAVARLAHPHIVAAYDFGQHEGRLYFVMEYVEGEDLHRLIQRREPLDERTTWGLLRQAAAGLAHAAELGIVHRDIKPANLLLVDPPAGFPLPPGLPLVKIADFGLARFTAEADERTRLTSTNHTIGSPHYMSPEQLRGEAVDSRSDIYALGCTAFHMFVGKPPLSGKSVSQIAALKLTGDLPMVEEHRRGVSRGSAGLVRRMMSLNVEDRPQDYHELIALIDNLLQQSPIGTSPGLSLSTEVTQAHGVPTAAGPQLTRRDAGPTDRAIAMAQALTSTVPIVATVPIPRPSTVRRHWPSLVLLVCVALLIGAFALSQGRHRPTRPLVTTGREIPLFDGETIDGWKTLSGSWHSARDEEGSPVLAGTDGVTERTLPAAFTKPNDASQEAGLRPLRVTVFARLHEAAAVEIQFGQTASGTSQSVRLTAEGSILGVRNARRNDFQASGKVVPFDRGGAQPHDVQIERQPNDWWVLVDGQVIGAVPAQAKELPKIRLLAEGGPAWFSDITVEELKSRPAEPAAAGP